MARGADHVQEGDRRGGKLLLPRVIRFLWDDLAQHPTRGRPLSPP